MNDDRKNSPGIYLTEVRRFSVICQNFSFPGNSYDGDKNKFRLGSTSDLKQVKRLEGRERRPDGL